MEQARVADHSMVLYQEGHVIVDMKEDSFQVFHVAFGRVKVVFIAAGAGVSAALRFAFRKSALAD